VEAKGRLRIKAVLDDLKKAKLDDKFSIEIKDWREL
jgi:hypothetical protein